MIIGVTITAEPRVRAITVMLRQGGVPSDAYIYLAKALGYIDATGAMRLRQGFDLVSHFDSERATEEMSITESVQVVRGCVQYVFGSEESLTAIDFSKFRERLSTETIAADDVSLEQLLESPLFFVRTALRVLLAAAKIEKAARLEHSLANLNTFLPGMWPRLTDDDRNSVGTTFAELSNVGTRPTATAGVRKALLKVKVLRRLLWVPEGSSKQGI